MPPAPQPTDPDRRDFMKKACCVAIGGVLGAVPVGAGVAFYLDPLRLKAEGAITVQVTTLDALPPDGVPRIFSIHAVHVDAWTKETTAIGAVYIRRLPDETLEAYNVVCPHNGCFVEYAPGETPKTKLKYDYVCPCHGSIFELDGKIVPNSHSPASRGLDSLECFASPDNPNNVMVTFQNFHVGIAAKIPLGS